MSPAGADPKSLRLCPDVLVVSEGGVWIASNPHARAHVAVSPSALELLRRCAAGEADPAAGLADLWAEDRTEFGCKDCLVDDATGLVRSPAARVSGLGPVAAKLVERSILITDLAAYRARFGPKTRPLGDEHFGTFHQQMGHHVAVRRRSNPDEWWVSQKFTDDLGGVKDTAYRKVQEAFLERRAPAWNLAGKRVLDVGCGVGYYSDFFAKRGAEVLGVDPSAPHIERARKTFKTPRLRFELFDFADPSKLSALGEGSFDFIYLADVLLFYLIPYNGKPTDPAVLLRPLRKLLKPGGRIVTMDPHGSFSLCARYGDPQRPLAVVSEYKHKDFGIAPNLESLVHAFRDSGLAVVDAWEPVDERPDGAAREDGFLREFPTWWVFELAPAP